MQRFHTWLRGRRRTIVATIFLMGLLPCSAAAQFQLQYFQVNSLSDEPDSALGDGVCSTLMGTCTLRAAVQEADVNAGTTIGVPPGLVVLLNGDLDITKNMTITGAGSDQTSINAANQNDRVFEIGPAATVTISGVTIEYGTARGKPFLDYRSHNHGGGIHNHGNLTLTDSVIRNNRIAQPCKALCGGAGMFSSGNAVLTNVTIIDNETLADGGGIEQGGGTLTLSGCTIMNNAAANGGGIFARGNLTMEHSFIAGNRATYGGGGLLIDTSGMATLTSVGFEGNIAPGGNGIWSLGNTTLQDVDVQSH
jgi:CSLREA domain-containing protein